MSSGFGIRKFLVSSKNIVSSRHTELETGHVCVFIELLANHHHEG